VTAVDEHVVSASSEESVSLAARASTREASSVIFFSMARFPPALGGSADCNGEELARSFAWSPGGQPGRRVP